MKVTSRPAIALAIAALLSTHAGAQSTEQRRKDIAAKGKQLFTNTANHCQAFRELTAFAADKAGSVSDLIEDLKFVLIGEELRRRGTGPHYIGREPGARGDKGFKSELRDGSPQVEHAWAAIYIGKMFPPGSAEVASLMTEVMGPLSSDGKLNSADILLWALGGDTGQRLAAANYKQLPNVISKTMCQ